MNTKLTLRLDRSLIEKAKAYALRTGKSVSQMVAEYFARLDAPQESTIQELPPLVRSLKGVLRGGKAGRSDYRRHIEEKYQ